MPFIQANIEPGSVIETDGWSGYNRLREQRRQSAAVGALDKDFFRGNGNILPLNPGEGFVVSGERNPLFREQTPFGRAEFATLQFFAAYAENSRGAGIGVGNRRGPLDRHHSIQDGVHNFPEERLLFYQLVEVHGFPFDGQEGGIGSAPCG